MHRGKEKSTIFNRAPEFVCEELRYCLIEYTLMSNCFVGKGGWEYQLVWILKLQIESGPQLECACHLLFSFVLGS